MAKVGDDERPGDRGSNRPPLAEDVQEMLEGLDTGDLVLFDRPCFKMGGFFGAAICSAAKVVGGSPYDHIGAVVRQQDGSNVLLEASFKGITARPLCERIRRSSATQICIRRLETNRTEEMREEARLFVSEVLHLPYKEGFEGLLQMAQAAFSFPPAKERRRRVHAEAVELSTSIVRLESELLSDADHPALKERLRRAMTRRRKAMVFLERAATRRVKTEAPTAAKNVTTSASPPAAAAAAESTAEGRAILPSSPSPSTAAAAAAAGVTTAIPLHEGGLFCSELVATLYQRLGLLDAPFPKSHDYTPADFAQSLESPVSDVGVFNGAIVSSVAASSNHEDASDRIGGTAKAPSDAILQAADSNIPRGGGRVALLGGASLGPGLWVRGGPRSPSPSPPPDSGAGGRGDGCGEYPPGSTTFGAAAKSPRSQRVMAEASALELGKPRDDDRGWEAVTGTGEEGWRRLPDAKQHCFSSRGCFVFLGLLSARDAFTALWSRLVTSSGSPPEYHPARGSPTATVTAVNMTIDMDVTSASSPDEPECLSWGLERSGEENYSEKLWRSLGHGQEQHRRMSNGNESAVCIPPMATATAVTVSPAIKSFALNARGRRGLVLGVAGGTIAVAAAACLAVVSDCVLTLAASEFHRD